MKPSKLDILIITVTLLLALGISLYAHFRLPSATKLEIYKEGQLYQTVSLNIDQSLTIKGKIGELIVKIQNGEAAVVKADCLLQVCKHLGKIKKSGETIVCIPNGVVLKIYGQDNFTDATTH